MEITAVQAALKQYGMKYEQALDRFAGNEKLMLSFVMEFPGEPYLTDIQSAHDANDEQAYADAVHALKGTSGSLGFTPLYEPCAALMTALRTDDRVGAETLYREVLTQHRRVCALIDGLK